MARLLDTNFIKEVYHPDWLANPVLVPKNSKEWRMYVDYTNLSEVLSDSNTCTNCKIQYPVYFISEVLSDSKT
jgi:hypothetical protein